MAVVRGWSVVDIPQHTTDPRCIRLATDPHSHLSNSLMACITRVDMVDVSNGSFTIAKVDT